MLHVEKNLNRSNVAIAQGSVLYIRNKMNNCLNNFKLDVNESKSIYQEVSQVTSFRERNIPENFLKSIAHQIKIHCKRVLKIC